MARRVSFRYPSSSISKWVLFLCWRPDGEARSAWLQVNTPHGAISRESLMNWYAPPTMNSSLFLEEAMR